MTQQWQFVPVEFNADLWINDKSLVQSSWARVGILTLWSDAHAAAKRYNHAPSVVGPLRLVDGIDILLRNMLANPQIRVLVIDGPAVGPIGEHTLRTLRTLWADGAEPAKLQDSVHSVAPQLMADIDAAGFPAMVALAAVFVQVKLLTRDEWRQPTTSVWDEDREGGRYPSLYTRSLHHPLGVHMRRVIVEHPYAGDIEENLRYGRACVADCLRRGEAPFASALLYTQVGVLDDTIPAEREHGIQAGFAWREMADATVVYTDRGISRGMQYGIDHAKPLVDHARHIVEYRTLGGAWTNLS